VTLEEIWQQKSDQELEFAARVISDYTEEAQEVIRAEIQRRGLTEPPQLPPTKVSVIQNEPYLLGNFLEQYRTGSFPGWIRAIIVAPILLIIGGFILTTSVSFLFKLTTGIFCIGGGIGIIYQTIQHRKHNILVYEHGIVYEQPNNRLSAHYEELQIWQESRYRRFLFTSVEVSRTYTLEFPTGKLLSISEDLADKLQVLVVQHQLPQAIAAYNQGYTLEFGAIRLHKKGIVIYGQGIPWSTVGHVSFRQGKIHIATSIARATYRDTVPILVADVPNVQVLISFLREQGYFQA
jgi:hypothetical protein